MSGLGHRQRDIHVSESEAGDDHMEVEAKEEFEPEAEVTEPQDFPPDTNLWKHSQRSFEVTGVE